MRTLALAAILATACGGQEIGTTAAAATACNSTCAIARTWTLTIEHSPSYFAVSQLQFGGGSPAQWTGPGACAFDFTFTGTTSGTGTASVTPVSDACGSFPASFSWTLDQCNCVLTVTDGASFNSLYY